MNRFQRFKCAAKKLWLAGDQFVFLLLTFGAGAVLAWGVAARQFDKERATLATERATLYATIENVRTDANKQCNVSLDALRDAQTQRAKDWLASLDALSTQVQNANHNADNCHNQMAALIPKINKAATDSKVAADKSTEAAQAATSEHAQQTLIRKYSK